MSDSILFHINIFFISFLLIVTLVAVSELDKSSVHRVI